MENITIMLKNTYATPIEDKNRVSLGPMAYVI